MSHEIRKGDVLHLPGGRVAEVLSSVANNEGGVDLTLRVAASRHELSRTVLRKGGPDERDEDKDTHFEDYDESEEELEESLEDFDDEDEE